MEDLICVMHASLLLMLPRKLPCCYNASVLNSDWSLSRRDLNTTEDKKTV